MSQRNICPVHSRVGEISNLHVVLGVPSTRYVHPHVRTICKSTMKTAYSKSKLSLAPCILGGACLSLASGNNTSAIDLAQRGSIKIYRIRGITVNGMSFFKNCFNGFTQLLAVGTVGSINFDETKKNKQITRSFSAFL